MGKHVDREPPEREEVVHSEWDSPSEPYKLACLGLLGLGLILVSVVLLGGLARLALLLVGCLLILGPALMLLISVVAYAVNRLGTYRGQGILYSLGTAASLGVGSLFGLDAITVGTAAFAAPVVLLIVAGRLAYRPTGSGVWRWRRSIAMSLVAVGSAITSGALLFL